MKTTKILSLIIIFVLLALLLTACNGSKIESIKVVEGSLKTLYTLDEVPDLSGAMLEIEYSSGKKETVELLSGMFNNAFDTATTGEKTLFITYKSVQTSFNYRVESDIEVDSPFRLTLSTKKTNLDLTLIIGSKNIEMIPSGVYAISFEVHLAGFNFVSINPYSEQESKLFYQKDGDVIKVIIYSKDINTPLTVSGNLATLKAQILSSESESVSISSISISDGQKDFTKIPDVFS